MKLSEQVVGSMTGQSIIQYTLMNDNGMEVDVLNLGATLIKVLVPDKKGTFENVVLRWRDLENYKDNPGYFGAVVGRVAGRIHQGKITLDDTVYELTKNENSNTLHGGDGFHSKLWQGENQSTPDTAKLQLTYFSQDGEEGFPGNLKVQVTYSLNNQNELTIEYKGNTDKATVVNLTNHAYFNLSGDGKRSILDQEVFIDSNAIYELDNESIPTGRLLSVEKENAFDFRAAKPIGRDIGVPSVQLEYGKGYDHIWHLNQGDSAIELYDPLSGRNMEITTTEPCTVMYTMNNPSNKELNIADQTIRYGVCFETQKCAVGYNEVFKENIMLIPSKTYEAVTTFKFSTK